MAQSLNRRAHSLLLMDPLAMWEHPDSLLRKAGGTNTRSGDVSAERRAPAVEVAESGDNLIISAELPGLSAEDVKVETIGNLLIIQGEHRPERGPEARAHGPERRRRYFYREIVLPDGADLHNARAEIDNGLLRIIIPVRVQGRQIPIATNNPA